MSDFSTCPTVFVCAVLSILNEWKSTFPFSAFRCFVSAGECSMYDTTSSKDFSREGRACKHVFQHCLGRNLRRNWVSKSLGYHFGALREINDMTLLPWTRAAQRRTQENKTRKEILKNILRLVYSPETICKQWKKPANQESRGKNTKKAKKSCYCTIS